MEKKRLLESAYTNKAAERAWIIPHGNFLDYLSSAYEVLRKIFSYLSLEDLETVGKAFENWLTVVETTRKERTNIETFVVYPKYPIQTLEFWSEASFCLTFCLYPNKDIQQKFKRYLNNDAEFLVVESRSGVIGTYSDLSRLIQRTNSNFTASSTASDCPTVHLRIPSIPDCGIKTFTCYRNSTFQDFKNNFRLPENVIIKCLLILVKNQGSSLESGDQNDDFVLFLKSTQSEDFAIGGCIVDWFVEDSDNRHSETITTKYIVFYGDKVQAASTVLKRNTITKKGIDQAVEELKDMCPKSSKGILFVFRCRSRNELSRPSKGRKCITDWEGSSIAKHFPNTPVIGCFGHGEFGRKFPEKVNPKPLAKKARQRNIWEYTYSTSMVYVGFKT